MALKIIGVGGYLPNEPISNLKLSEIVDTSDEWIVPRTGINARYFTTKEQTTAFLAYQAALLAIEDSQIAPQDLDMIIVCTTTPDTAFPSTASVVQGMLGLKNSAAMDINAVCAGFVYGLHLSNSLLETRSAKNILLIGAERMSSVLDWKDRSTAVLFGDGAGAVVVKNEDDNLFSSIIKTDGSLSNILYSFKDNADNLSGEKIFMNGAEVYKHAIDKMANCSKEILEKNNLLVSDLDLVVPHQANIRIINAMAEKLSISDDKIVKTVGKHANTSAASIPLALYEYKKAGNSTKNKLALFTAIGAGMSWGSAITRL